MNRSLICKLLAALLACAVLLASIAAIADDAVPTSVPAATAEPAGEPEITAEPATAEGSEPAEEPATTEEPETTTEPETTAEPDTTSEPEATGEPETTENPEGDASGVPPINTDGLPNVQDSAEDGEGADDESGFEPRYFHEHEHQYVLKPAHPGWEDTNKYEHYEWVSSAAHHRYNGVMQEYECLGCSDLKSESIQVHSKYEPHYDANNDGWCDACESPDCEFAEEPIEDSSFSDAKNCDHAGTTWSDPEIEYDYDEIPAGYDVTNDSQDSGNYDAPADQSIGHTKRTYLIYSGTCPKCKHYVEKSEQERVFQPHSFSNSSKCACGYEKSSATPAPAPEVTPEPTSTTTPTAALTSAPTKEAEDTRVRIGVKLIQEIRQLIKNDADITIVNEKLAYSEDEFSAVSAIADPFERTMLLLTALGYGDEVDYALRYMGLELSDAAQFLFDRLLTRSATTNPEALSAFLSTETIDGVSCDVVIITLQLSDSADHTLSFTFYKDGDKLYYAE